MRQEFGNFTNGITNGTSNDFHDGSVDNISCLVSISLIIIFFVFFYKIAKGYCCINNGARDNGAIDNGGPTLDNHDGDSARRPSMGR